MKIFYFTITLISVTNGAYAVPLLHIYTLSLLSGPNPIPEFEEKVKQLTDFGVDDEIARATLSQFNWDVTRASSHLFS